tara:strand:+ start:2843 stop:3394 length:552 start_codon:yes stop_codon:yes gene_type:complete
MISNTEYKLIKHFLFFVFLMGILFGAAEKALGDEVLTRDEQIVAATLLGEARGEGRCGVYAVGCVLQQRSINRNLSPAEICLQNDQFSCWEIGGKKLTLLEANKKYYNQGGPIMYARQLARMIVAKRPLDRTFVGNADHFHAQWKMKKNKQGKMEKVLVKSPYWAKKENFTVIIGNHKFYKLK